jgi:hypothetical protein
MLTTQDFLMRILGSWPAGCSSNNNAQGIKLLWHDLKRNICGSAGTNLSLQLKNFILSLLTNIKLPSVLHVGKLVKSNRGLNSNFPMKPTTLPDIWSAAPCMNYRTLLLSHVGTGGDMQSIGKIIMMSVSDIILPTGQVIRILERRGYKLIEELSDALQPLNLQYQQLIHKDLGDFYDGDTGTFGPKHMLDVMVSSFASFLIILVSSRIVLLLYLLTMRRAFIASGPRDLLVAVNVLSILISASILYMMHASKAFFSFRKLILNLMVQIS